MKRYQKIRIGLFIEKVRKEFNWLTYLLLTILALQLCFFIWAINKGFDFTDEAFSYLGFKNPEEIKNTVTYYALIYERLFGWIGISIVKIRIVRLLLLLICGAFFANSLIRFIKTVSVQEKTEHVNLFLFILIGCLLINANGSQSLTYNLMSVLFLQLIVGTSFLILATNETFVNWKQVILLFFKGGILFLLFATKYSNVILILPLIALINLTAKNSFAVKSVRLCIIFAGATSFGFLIFGLAFFDWLANYINTLTILSKDIGSKVWSRYIEDYHYTLGSKIIKNLSTIITCMVLLIICRILHNKKISIAIPPIIAGLVVHMIYTNEFYLGGASHYYTYTGLYIIIIFAFLITHFIQKLIDLYKKIEVHNIKTVIIIYLLSIPPIGIIGSTNLISIQLIWYMSFIFGALYLLFQTYSRLMVYTLTVVIALNATLQSISGLIYFPYRINDTLFNESSTLDKITRENINVNLSIKMSIDSVYRLIHMKTTFGQGDPIFSFASDYDGFIYLLDGTLPAWGWYAEKPTKANQMSIMGADRKHWPKTIFLMPVNYKVDSMYLDCFRKLHINFPNDYVPLGNVSYSIEHVERPLTIYAPKKIIKQ